MSIFHQKKSQFHNKTSKKRIQPLILRDWIPAYSFYNFQFTFQLPLRRAPLKKSAIFIAFLPACCIVIIEI